MRERVRLLHENNGLLLKAFLFKYLSTKERHEVYHLQLQTTRSLVTRASKQHDLFFKIFQNGGEGESGALRSF